MVYCLHFQQCERMSAVEKEHKIPIPWSRQICRHQEAPWLSLLVFPMLCAVSNSLLAWALGRHRAAIVRLCQGSLGGLRLMTCTRETRTMIFSSPEMRILQKRNVSATQDILA